MASFYDVTEWDEKSYFNTKGTRNKSVVSNPSTNEDYYFKTSMIKEGKNYASEFWSEIVASKVGRTLGFNVLEYDIAKHGEDVGCISKSMISDEKEALIEGVSLLTGYDNTYTPEDKSSYSAYTFQFIRLALQFFDFKESIRDLIKTIIFDSLIGNSDRHQENWGFIIPFKKEEFNEEESVNFFKKVARRVKGIGKGTVADVPKDIDSNIKPNILKMKGEYAPIYDSGCSLAREKTNSAVSQMLKDELMLNSYVNRGKAEIRWGDEGKKLNHFELIEEIRKESDEYASIVDDEIKRVRKAFDADKIKAIIHNIDSKLPDELKENFGLSAERKELMCILIEKRLARLKEVIA